MRNRPSSRGQTDPAGFLCLQQARPYGDSVPVWDVVDRSGKQARTVQLPKSSTLAGFGAEGRLYVILRDADGQRVGRYTVK